MDRQERIRIKQYGNVLQIILEIPWQDVHGLNAWEDYLKNKQIPVNLQDWNEQKAKIINTYKAVNNISATAKLCKCSYYIAYDTIRRDKAEQNRRRRQETIAEAKRLASAGITTKEIARKLGKSKETIRLWLKS